jgi:hypothetical protein
VNERATLFHSWTETRLAADLPFKLLSGDPSSMPCSIRCSTSSITRLCIVGRFSGMIRQPASSRPHRILLFYLRPRDIAQVIPRIDSAASFERTFF